MAGAIVNKVLTRILELPKGRKKGTEWARHHAQEIVPFLRTIDRELAAETLSVLPGLARRGAERLAAVPHDLGGGGCTPLLYFLVRALRPRAVLETGVAAGHSSLVILEALERNARGTLYSSDLPYFRLPSPERFVGMAVPERLRGRWTLELDGDRANIPRLTKLAGPIDLVHYDSDKSFRGRQWFVNQIRPSLAKDAVLVMDDIQDNVFFQEMVEGTTDWKVFEWEGKYVGVVGMHAAGLRP